LGVNICDEESYVNIKVLVEINTDVIWRRIMDDMVEIAENIMKESKINILK